MPSQPEEPTDDAVAALRDRLTWLEAEQRHRRRFGGFARLYAGLASVLAALTFLPLYNDLTHKDDGFSISWTFGSIWQILTVDNSGAGFFGLLLFAVVECLLVAAVFTPRVTPAPLISAAALSALIITLIALKPAMPDPPPTIADGGHAAIGVLGLIIISTAVHAGMLISDARNQT